MTKKIFITGGTTGIGLEVAKLYLEQGFNVGICGRDLNKVETEFSKKYNNQLHLFQVDVYQKKELEVALDHFCDDAPLDIMIANAGISVGKKSSTPDFNSDLLVTQTNTIGFLNTVYCALEHMLKFKSGHIVATSSVAGFVGLPGAASYSASKSYVTKFCESLNLDLKEKNIIVSVICPGFIDTPLTRKNDHAMPFLMSASSAAVIIKRAIDRKKILFIFPWQMKVLIIFLNKIPRSLYRILMKLPFANYSK